MSLHVLSRGFLQNYGSSLSYVSTLKAAWNHRGITPRGNHQPSWINAHKPMLWTESSEGHSSGSSEGPRGPKDQVSIIH